MTELLFKLGITLFLFCIGWYFGSRTERRHLQQLAQQEARLAYIRVGSRRLEVREQQRGQLVMANVVISHDYFKFVWAQIHSFFGGNLKTYESLLERARREALLRLKQEAEQLGASEILAVRFSVSAIAGQGSVEVLAYGTAIYQAQGRIQPAWPPHLH